MDERVKAALLLGGGIVGFGLLDYALAQAGYGSLGAAVWAMGYLGIVLVIWYGWIRPLELTGP